MGVFIHEAEIVDADDQQNDKTLDGSTFYSDSQNDLMLKLDGNPIVVNADPILRKTAQEKGWRILDWM